MKVWETKIVDKDGTVSYEKTNTTDENCLEIIAKSVAFNIFKKRSNIQYLRIEIYESEDIDT